MKVTIVGAGQVGATLAQRVVNLGDVQEGDTLQHGPTKNYKISKRVGHARIKKN